MKKIIIILSILISLNAYADSVYEGQNCITYSKLIFIIENFRDNKISKKDFIKKISESDLDNSVKKFLFDHADLVYNLPINSKYSKSIMKECMRNGKIIIKEV